MLTGPCALGRENFMRTMKALEKLNANQIAQLAEKVKVRQFRKGQVIVEAGHALMSIYIVRRGTVVVRQTNPPIKTLETLNPKLN